MSTTVSHQTVRSYILENWVIQEILVDLALKRIESQEIIAKARAQGHDVRSTAERIANYFLWDAEPWST